MRKSIKNDELYGLVPSCFCSMLSAVFSVLSKIVSPVLLAKLKRIIVLYRDSQIAERLEITGHRGLHFLSGHLTPRRNQLPAWKPVRGRNPKIMLLPRLYLPVHEFPDLHPVIVFGNVLSHRFVLFRARIASAMGRHCVAG